MTNHRTFEEIPEGETRETRGRTITNADVVNFAGVSGDFHPLHTNEEFAAETRFEDRIAHGLLVLCVTAGLVMEYNQHAFYYGIDDLRFVNPTYFGDTINANTTVTEKSIRDDEWGLVRTKTEATNQRDEPVISYELLELVERERT